LVDSLGFLCYGKRGALLLGTIFNYLHRVNTYNHPVIEFAIIGLVVYWAISFLEGTRGERLFHGVIFILIAGSLILNLVVQRFGFERLEYLYKGFFVAVLIIAVSGFQPEIRRAVMRIGQTPFFSRAKRQLSHTVEEVISAVNQMSQSRTGAIIVIEQQVQLGEFIETGVRLDANVSSELLKTIFYPGTSLHDMAVVIRGDSIIAARVQLPLTEAATLGGRELGSRHRAAIGITSGSDALCIIVSEETGIVSVATNGKLKRNISEEDIRNILADVVGFQKESKLQKKVVV
jgi:diadenylate cyclase